MLASCTKQYRENAMAVLAAVLFGFITSDAGAADPTGTTVSSETTGAADSTTSAMINMANRNPELDKAVMDALEECRRISTSCASTTQNVPGILVFPKVIKADLILGGAGGKGALIENGKITGYYNIGAGSAGLQAGVESSSQVYVFRTSEALDQLKEGRDWRAGATAGVTLIEADKHASAATGNVLVYVFDAKGLNAGIALNVFNVWKADQTRPAQS